MMNCRRYCDKIMGGSKIHVKDIKSRITCALNFHGSIFNKTGTNTKIPIKVTFSWTNTITRIMVTIYGSRSKSRSKLNEIITRVIEFYFDQFDSKLITLIKTICDLQPNY